MTEETFYNQLRRLCNQDITTITDSVMGKPVAHEFYCEQVGKCKGLKAALAHIDTVLRGEIEIDLEED